MTPLMVIASAPEISKPKLSLIITEPQLYIKFFLLVLALKTPTIPDPAKPPGIKSLLNAVRRFNDTFPLALNSKPWLPLFKKLLTPLRTMVLLSSPSVYSLLSKNAPFSPFELAYTLLSVMVPSVLIITPVLLFALKLLSPVIATFTVVVEVLSLGVL